jgi:glucan phosphoethanolaminetransferase (alkaline phosphatase superfamily)
MATLISLFLFFVISSNSVIYLTFGEYLSVYMVNYAKNDPMYWFNGFHDHFLNVNILGLIACLWLFFWIWMPSVNSKYEPITLYKLFSWVFIPILLFAGLNQLVPFSKENRLNLFTATLSAFADTYYLSSPTTLGPSKNRAIISKLTPTPSSNLNFIVIVTESFGKGMDGLPFYGHKTNAMPFLSQWIEKEKNNFFIFENAYTSSTASEISMMSILSGMAPYKTSKDFNKNPLLWDWLAPLNYDTFFITSQRLGNLKGFIKSEGLDLYVGSDDFDESSVNDAGIDDLISVDYFCTKLKENRDVPFLGVYGNNALHGPFQQTSTKLTTQPSFKNIYLNSLFIIDKTLEKIYSALKESNSLKNTVIIITSDHGEMVTHIRDIPRIYSFYEEYINIPFMVFLPDKLRKKKTHIVSQLAKNLKKNIGNVDILPTLLDLAGTLQNNPYPQFLGNLDGSSLIKHIPSNRMLTVLNTNDFRHWNHEGFALIKENHKFISSDREGSLLYDLSKDPLETKALPLDEHSEKLSIYESFIKKHYHLDRIYNSEFGLKLRSINLNYL